LHTERVTKKPAVLVQAKCHKLKNFSPIMPQPSLGKRRAIPELSRRISLFTGPLCKRCACTFSGETDASNLYTIELIMSPIPSIRRRGGQCREWAW